MMYSIFIKKIEGSFSRLQLRNIGEDFVIDCSAKKYNLQRGDFAIVRSEYGKPHFDTGLVGGFVKFSISHSEGFLVVVIGEIELGIDIESEVRAVPSRVAKRFLSGSTDIRSWVRYEARGKLFGCGVPVPKDILHLPIIFDEPNLLPGFVICIARKF